jgi:hypothetical protein
MNGMQHHSIGPGGSGQTLDDLCFSNNIWLMDVQCSEWGQTVNWMTSEHHSGWWEPFR